ncbi:MAG: purine-nucleoside/S-methyl-5-thioadenosine phosphorylase / adenosine deaminase [Gaiellaceae bacterium]|jgi:YfiH family protein|nr:purine-nucleoside/S-methyl-5-thioadenosine phosphorylase / adenosine deaminase [Gaiellaceae bacterium]
MSVALISWDPPGPYSVAFTTRRGGVSKGSFESLNLGLLTDDAPVNVEENRRRLCEAAGADFAGLAMNRQMHAATVNRAEAGERGRDGDGLWTDEPGVSMLKVTADCLPVALARRDGQKPALALLHAGRSGLLQGILEAGVAALGGRLAAAIGPGIGPCCYEVGEDIARPYRLRFGAGVVRGRNLDLWTIAERLLRGAGVESVVRLDLCTACDADQFFSHRRDGPVTGRQGVIGYVT